MYERFSDRARKVMSLANQEAQRFNAEQVDAPHLLLGLLKEVSGVGAKILSNHGLNLEEVRHVVESYLPIRPAMVTMGQLPLTPAAKKVIDDTLEEARLDNRNYVGTEHLLLGLLRSVNPVVAGVWDNLGLSVDLVRSQIQSLRSESNPEHKLWRLNVAAEPRTPLVNLVQVGNAWVNPDEIAAFNLYQVVDLPPVVWVVDIILRSGTILYPGEFMTREEADTWLISTLTSLGVKCNVKPEGGSSNTPDQHQDVAADGGREEVPVSAASE